MKFCALTIFVVVALIVHFVSAAPITCTAVGKTPATAYVGTSPINTEPRPGVCQIFVSGSSSLSGTTTSCAAYDGYPLILATRNDRKEFERWWNDGDTAALFWTSLVFDEALSTGFMFADGTVAEGLDFDIGSPGSGTSSQVFRYYSGSARRHFVASSSGDSANRFCTARKDCSVTNCAYCALRVTDLCHQCERGYQAPGCTVKATRGTWLMVVGQNFEIESVSIGANNLRATDKYILDYLHAQDYAVVVVSSLWAATADAIDKVGIVITANVAVNAAKELQGLYRDSNIPLVILSSKITSWMYFGVEEGCATGANYVVDVPAHPLVAGVSGAFFAGSPSICRVGTLGAGFTKIAGRSGVTTSATLGVYQTGSLQRSFGGVDYIAAARTVLFSVADNIAPGDITASGAAVFDNVFRYAVAKPVDQFFIVGVSRPVVGIPTTSSAFTMALTFQSITAADTYPGLEWGLAATGTACASVPVALTFALSGASSLMPLSSSLTPGVYDVCVRSYDEPTWMLQSFPGLTVEFVTTKPNEIVALSPASIGVSAPIPALTFIGSGPHWASSLVALSLDPLCGSLFAGTKTAYPGPGQAIAIGAGVLTASGDYTVCLSHSADGVFVPQQAKLRVVTATAFTGISPSVFSSSQSPTFSITGAEYTDTGTIIAFAPFSASCSLVGTHVASVTLTQPQSSITLAPLAAGEYDICYSLNSGSSWTKISPALSIVAISPTAVTLTSPTLLAGPASSIPIAFTAPSLASFASSLAVALSTVPSSNGACNSANLVAPLVYDGSTFSATVRLAPSFPPPPPNPIAAGTYYVCISTQSALNDAWVAQSPGISITLVAPEPATALTFSSPSPVVHGQGDIVLAFSKLTPPPPSPLQIAFAPNGDCAGATAGFGLTASATAYAASQTYTFAPKTQDCSAASVTYMPCLSNDVTLGGTPRWVAQTSASFVVACPLISVVTAVAPSTFLNATVPTVLLTGAVPSPETWVALSLDPDCTPASLFGQTAMTTNPVTFAPSGEIAQITTHYLCYSTDGGSTYLPQPLVALAVTTNPIESFVELVTPSALGLGTTPTITVTGTLSSTSQIAFSLDNCVSVVGVTSTPSSPTVTALGAAITTPGVYTACYRNHSSDPSWTAQISSGSKLTIVATTPSSITAASPAAFGVGTTPVISLSGLVVTPTTHFALTSSGVCDGTAVALTNVTHSTTTSVTLKTSIGVAGPYSVCYATNSSDPAEMVLQPAVSFVVVAATAGSIALRTPADASLPFGSNTAITLTGPGLQPSVFASLTFVDGFASGCGGTVVHTFSLATSLVLNLASAAIPAGEYAVCYSVDGSTYVKQTTVGVQIAFRDATSTSVAGLSPIHIGTGTAPPLMFATNNLVLVTAAVALAKTGGDCTNSLDRESTVVIGTGSTAVFNSPPVAPTGALTTYKVCANEDPAVASWVEQTGITLNVYSASSTSITSIVPTTIAVGQTKAFTVTSGTIVPTPFARIAFSAQPDCTQRQGLLDVATSFSSVPLAPTVASTNLYTACYSIDAGLTWTAQTGQTLRVIEATSTSIVALLPAVVGKGTVPWFTGLASLPVTSDSFAYLASDSGCTTPTTVIPIVTPVSGEIQAGGPVGGSGLQYVCYTVDNYATEVLQGAPLVRVIEALPTSITSVTPVIGAGHSGVAVTFAGATEFIPALESQVAFVASGGDCGVGPLVGTTPYTAASVTSGTVALLSAIATPGVYDVCYTVDGGATWAQQTSPGVSVTVITATPWDVVDISPPIISVRVPVDFTFVLNATSVSAVASPSTYIAFAPSSGPCSPVISPVPYSGGAPEFALSGEITAADTLQVCWSTDGGATYVGQIDASIDVVLTSNTTVSALSVTRVGEGEASPVTLIGAVSTANTRVAFVTTNCDDSAAIAATLVPLVSSTTVEIMLNAGVYKLCYSTDAGTVWTEQVLVSLEVVNCLTATTCSGCATAESGACSWCMGDATCRAIQDAPVCTQQVLNATDACPTLSFTGIPSGSLAGATEIPVTSQYDFPSPLDAFTCSFLLSDGSTLVANVSAGSAANVINCVSPASTVDDLASVTVLFLGAPYADGSPAIPFRYYDCQADSCTSCFSQNKPECGFCFGSDFCGTQFECGDGTGAGPSLWSQVACSTIESNDPVSGPPVGGDLITVTGTNFAAGVDFACKYSGGTDEPFQVNDTVWNSETEVICTSPTARVGDLFEISLVFRESGSPYTVSTGIYSVQGVGAAPAPSPPFYQSPFVIGGGVLAVCLIAIVVAILILLLTRTKDQGPQVPKLTPALLRDTIFGKGLSNPADARAYLAHLQPFIDLIREEDRQAIFSVCDVTQATEADDISKAIIYLFERDNKTVAVLSSFVRKEIKAAISQSTMFRTNSFATKMFKAYSKMVGLPYLHSTLAVLINRIMVQEGENIGSFRSAAGATDANRSKFTLLQSCQKIFNAIVRSEKHIPVQFRQIFAVVRECIREEFPIKMENLAAVVSSQMLAGLHSTQAAYEEGVDSFQNLEYMDEHVTDDLEQLKHVIAPVQNLVQTFASTVQTLSVQLKKMMNACESLEGALDPSSPAARRLLEEHTNSQNSIAVGGFFFLRFLVPSITAPESYVLVEDPPQPDERRALVMIGKVIQNLSNNKEFGGKEAHMQQLNDFIFSNKAEVNALFDRLCKMEVFVAPPAVDIPKKHYEAAQLKLFLHTKRNLAKVVDNLLDNPEGTPADLVSLRQQTAGNLAATVESIATRAAPGGSLDQADANMFQDVRMTILNTMSGARSVVQANASGSGSSSSSSSSDGAAVIGTTPATVIADSPLAAAAADDGVGGIELAAL